MTGLYLARFWEALADRAWSMAGYFFLAVFLAAFIKTFKWDKKIRRFLEQAGPLAIPLATFAGLVSPLCSCGILPVAASLAAAGVPAGPVMALLITSPVMSPDALVLTWGVLGRSMAIGKLATAAMMGLLLGYLVQLAENRGWLPRGGMHLAGTRAAHHCVDAEDLDDPRRGLTVRINRGRYFLLMFWDMVSIIGRFMILAIVLDALLVTFVRANTVKMLLGAHSLPSVLLAVAIGIPLPLHQVAVVPIAKGLLELGAERGAVMALIMAGPVMSIPSVVFLSQLVSRRLLALYLLVGVLGSLLVGVVFL